jgi:transcriptional repressor NrdR
VPSSVGLESTTDVSFSLQNGQKITMICPFCREKDTSVVDSRPTEDGTAIRRRRICACGGGQRFTTFERVQFRELTVIKKNGKRSPFDREKLAKSLFTALKKRPIDND